MVDVSAKTETVRADSSLNQILFYTGEFVYNVGCKIPGYNLPHRVERNRSIPYTRPSRFPGGGSVQQGLSAAYEFIAMFKLRCAADKRYSFDMDIPQEFDGKIIKNMSQIFLITTLTSLIPIFPAFADSTHDAIGIDLEVVVDGVSNSHGNVRVAIFSEADAALFPDNLPPLKQSVAAAGQAINVNFNNLATGHYAALVFQDENSNEMLDRNFFGIPKERWGVTGTRPFGRNPRYAESTFMLDREHHKITIHLE